MLPVEIETITVRPIYSHAFLPPAQWKGDCVGHIGGNDVFFYVLEGECFLLIEDSVSIIRPGQLAFLPKGKQRMYTHASQQFAMYELAFSAEADGKNLMSLLNLDTHDYVADIADKDEMRRLFENMHYTELYKNPLYDVGWCADILTIIKRYGEARNRQNEKDVQNFRSVLQFMTENISDTVTTEQLSALVFMQPTYFIRKFKNTFGLSPKSYFNRLKLFKAMNLLASTSLSLEKVSATIGIEDTSYFARFFKKGAGISPSEYKKAFKK